MKNDDMGNAIRDVRKLASVWVKEMMRGERIRS